MKSLRVLIADDEPVARRRLRRLLAGEPGVDVVGEAADGPATLERVRELRPDVLLLDIQMPEMSGLDVVTQLERPRPHIVFVTAHDAHAVRAFELHALDYLLKPIAPARLADAVARARRAPAPARDRAIDARLDAWSTWADARRVVTHLPVQSSGRVDIVPVRTIDWIEAADNYVILHCGAARHVMREPIGRLADRLAGSRFMRIHRSTIVQRDRVVRMTARSRGDWTVWLADGTELVMSRTHRRIEADGRS